jgi:hypothetical protein
MARPNGHNVTNYAPESLPKDSFLDRGVVSVIAHFTHDRIVGVIAWFGQAVHRDAGQAPWSHKAFGDHRRSGTQLSTKSIGKSRIG